MKRLFSFLYVPLVIFLMSGCFGSNSDRITPRNVHTQPNFSGVVMEVHEQSVLVSSRPTDFMGSSLIWTSLNTYLGNNPDIMAGDEVVVYHCGMLLASWPAQTHTVYAIQLLRPSKLESWADVQIVQVLHPLDYPISGFSTSWESQVETLRNWFADLQLVEADSPDGGVSDDSHAAIVYEFRLFDSNGEYTKFTYGEYAPHQWYLFFDGTWYRVGNPSFIMFPVKQEDITFEARPRVVQHWHSPFRHGVTPVHPFAWSMVDLVRDVPRIVWDENGPISDYVHSLLIDIDGNGTIGMFLHVNSPEDANFSVIYPHNDGQWHLNHTLTPWLLSQSSIKIGESPFITRIATANADIVYDIYSLTPEGLTGTSSLRETAAGRFYYNGDAVSAERFQTLREFYNINDSRWIDRPDETAKIFTMPPTGQSPTF